MAADSLTDPVPATGGASQGALNALFFVHAGAMALYTVPFANVMKANGLGEYTSWAMATGGIAAFISPMIVGSLADRRLSPERLLAGICALSALFLTLSFTAIDRGWGPGWFLALTMALALSYAPGFGLVTTIVLSRLTNPQRQFGPIRVWATWGWCAASLAVTWVLHADESVRSGYSAALVFVAEAVFCLTLRPTPPPADRAPRRWRDLFGWEAIRLLRHPDHRMIFLTSALLSAILTTFYRYTSEHLKAIGVEHASATMATAQVFESVAMFALGSVLVRFRIKWVLAAALALGIVRLGLMTSGALPALVLSICLHGPVFTLFYPTSQLYLEERVDKRMRAQSQALLSLLNSGIGNLSGYLLINLWHRHCTVDGVTDWPRFWSALTVALAAVLVLFLVTYKGQKRSPVKLAGET